MIALRDTPLDAAAAARDGGRRRARRHRLFVGTTRREAGEREVATLHYEAYEELALTEMAAIAAEAERAFGARVRVEHRTGAVEVGAPSVVVAASAGHRPAAFAACRFVIDELKARVPIWKQTVYADGATSWIDGCAAGHHHPTARSHHA